MKESALFFQNDVLKTVCDVCRYFGRNAVVWDMPLRSLEQIKIIE